MTGIHEGTKMSDHIVVETQSRVLTIRLNRPEKKNALTQAMYRSMTEGLLAAEADRSVRAVMITGTESTFTAGNDIVDFANARPGEPSAAITFLQTLAAAQKPVIAAVNGLAIGIGTTLLLHCDLVYAAASARFQLPFVNLGLCPEAGSSFILPLLAGYQRAAQLVFFGEPFGAEEAHGLGMVNAVIADNDLLSFATDKARQLAEKPPGALAATKRLLKQGTQVLRSEAMSREAEQFAAALQAPEAREAMAAFLERRKPDFSKF
jgi:enoyl-CoA hydratase/carnithine racemase